MKRQFLGLFTSRAVATAVQAGTFILLARLLEVHELGLVGVVISVGAFSAMVSDFGMATLTSRSRAIGDNSIVRGALRFNNLTAAAVGFLGFLIILFGGGSSMTSLALGILFIATLFERNAETSLSIPFADGNTTAPAVSIIGRRFTAAITLIVLLLLGVSALEAYCFGQLAGAAFGFVHKSLGEKKHISRDGTPTGIPGLIRKAWPFWVSAVSNQARVLDAALVGGLLGAFAAGIYSAAMKIVNPLNMFPVALASILLPHATRVEPGAIGKLTRNIVLLFLSMYIVLAVPIVFSTEIIVFILGAPYRESGPILALALAVLPLLGLANPLVGILQARGAERFAAYNSVIFAVVIIVAIAGLTLLLGPAGAVIAIGATCLLRCLSLLVGIRNLASGHTILPTESAV